MKKPLLDSDLALLLLRIVVGGLMLLHGIDKIQSGIGNIEGMLQAKGLPGNLAWGVYVGEIIAPILIMLGFLTRPAGLMIAFNMAMSIWLFYGMNALSLGEQGGLTIELNLLYLIGGLTLFLSGGGRMGVTRGEGKWS